MHPKTLNKKLPGKRNFGLTLEHLSIHEASKIIKKVASKKRRIEDKKEIELGD